MSINLKNETLEVLLEHGKTDSDVVWVGTEGAKIPLCDFWKAADSSYDNGYGGTEVNEDLIVVGVNWWLERHEYDGAEWWEYKEQPPQPHIIETKDIQHIIFPDPWHKMQSEVQ